MTTIENKIRAEEANLLQYKDEISIENHKRTEAHLNAAKQYYLDAEKFNKLGDREQANQYTAKSKEELRLASQALEKELNFYSTLETH